MGYKYCTLIVLLCFFVLPTGLQARKKMPAGDPDSAEPTDGYVHKWVKFPQVEAARINSSETVKIKHVKGNFIVVVFLASWNVPSQVITPEILKLEREFSHLGVDFYYIFKHDTREDASGFMKEYKLESGLVASHDVIKAFHNPDLPSVYLGDRHGWLVARFLRTSKSNLREIRRILQYGTSF